MTYTVKAVADMAGVTIRALHHYDALGLVKPSSVSPSGYRLYSAEALERLQQVLFFKELGFTLKDIKRIIDSPGFDRKEALIAHRELLQERQTRLATLLRTVDETIKTLTKGDHLSASSMFSGFDKAKEEEYRREARERWGPVVDESYERVSKYSPTEMQAMQEEIAGITDGLAAVMEANAGPDSAEAQALVGRWYEIINDRFYACSPQMFRGLGDLYVQDPRFAATYDRVKSGLSAFKREAMHIYAGRLEPGR